MAFLDMIAEIRGVVPKLPVPFAKTLINRAWADVRRRNLWSFQLYEGPQWISPAVVNTGLVTTVQGSTTVTVDATAAAAINAAALAQTFSPITSRQFRIAAGTIYNIWGWDSVSTLTLDRPYGEASRTLYAYAIYQCYYPAPYSDHLTWISVRDMQNFIDLFTNKTRAQIDAADPQRTWYYFPTDVVYYQQNQNPNAATYRFPMYELWGSPQYSLNWQLYGIRRLTDLTANSDTLPPAMGEDCLISLAKAYAYEWAEANKGAIPRNQGPDFRFLIGAANAEFKALYQQYRREDRETVNNWFSIRRLGMYGKVFAYYSTLSNTAFPGVGWPG